MNDDPKNNTPQTEQPQDATPADDSPPEDSEWDTAAPTSSLLTNTAKPPLNRDTLPLTEKEE